MWILAAAHTWRAFENPFCNQISLPCLGGLWASHFPQLSLSFLFCDMWPTTTSKGWGWASFVCRELWNPPGWCGAERYTTCCEGSVTAVHHLGVAGGGTGAGVWFKTLRSWCGKSLSEWKRRQFHCAVRGLLSSTQQGQGWRPGNTNMLRSTSWVLTILFKTRIKKAKPKLRLSQFLLMQAAPWATSYWTCSEVAKSYFHSEKSVSPSLVTRIRLGCQQA